MRVDTSNASMQKYVGLTRLHNTESSRKTVSDQSDKPTVLIVEDEWLIAEDLKARLEGLGARVIGPADSCSAALEAIWNERPDFAYVDTRLGSETCEVVLEECDRQHIPLIIATAHAPENRPAYVVGRTVIGKPFDQAVVAQSFQDLQALLTKD